MNTETIEKGTCFTSPDGYHCRYVKKLKDAYKLNVISYDDPRPSIKVKSMDGFRKHTIPSALKLGDTLVRFNKPVKVLSFANLGGRVFVELEGEIDSHLEPLTKQSLLDNCYREPFQGEVFD